MRVILSNNQARVLFKLQKGFVIEADRQFGHRFVLKKKSIGGRTLSVSEAVVTCLQIWGIVETPLFNEDGYYQIWKATPKGMGLKLEDIEISDSFLQQGSYVLFDMEFDCHWKNEKGISCNPHMITKIDGDLFFLEDMRHPVPSAKCEPLICPECRRSVYINTPDRLLCSECFERIYEEPYND